MAKDVVIKIAAKDMASKVMAAISSNVKKMASNVTAASKKIGIATKNMGLAFVKLGAVVLAAATGGFAVLVSKASDMQEAMGKFAVVFGDAAGEVEASAKSMAAELGVSRMEIIQMLGNMQDLLVPMGVATEQATGMSQQMARLAVDLGSFNNMASEQVFGDLQAAITGSGEVMKKYGVVLNETAVKQELLNMGMDPANADDAAKAQARLNIIMAGTTAAQGDAVRTAGSFANQIKQLKANFLDIAVTIGGPFLQGLADAASVINNRLGGAFSLVESQASNLRAIGNSVGNSLSGIFNVVADGISIAAGLIVEHMDTIVGTFRVVETVLSNLPVVWELASTKMSFHALQFANDLAYFFTDLVPHKFEVFKNSTTNIFKSIVREVVDLWKSMVQRILNLLESLTQYAIPFVNVVEAGVDRLQQGVNFLDAMSDELAPTTVAPLGERKQTPEEQALAARAAEAQKTLMQDFMTRMKPAIEETVETAKAPAQQAEAVNIGNLFGKVSSFIGGAVDKVAGVIGEMSTQVEEQPNRFSEGVQAAQSRLLTRGIARDPQKEIIAESKKQNAFLQQMSGFLSRIADGVETTGTGPQIEVVE
jgi:hypothetical protein